MFQSSTTQFSLFSNIDNIDDVDNYEIIKGLIANYGNANINYKLLCGIYR